MYNEPLKPSMEEPEENEGNVSGGELVEPAPNYRILNNFITVFLYLINRYDL